MCFLTGHRGASNQFAFLVIQILNCAGRLWPGKEGTALKRYGQVYFKVSRRAKKIHRGWRFRFRNPLPSVRAAKSEQFCEGVCRATVLRTRLRSPRNRLAECELGAA